MFSQLVSGERSKGGEKNRFKVCINVVVNNMGVCNIWETLAENGTDWRKFGENNV